MSEPFMDVAMAINQWYILQHLVILCDTLTSTLLLEGCGMNIGFMWRHGLTAVLYGLGTADRDGLCPHCPSS